MSAAVQQFVPPPAAARPSTMGQATAVEQSRAIAEVQAAVVVAQQTPRDVQASLTAMRESCQQPALANRAFFRYSRGGSLITGPSVHLARELARCWGNMQYGLHEMRRDDRAGESEMQAFAWDVQTNTRNASTFIVPHRRAGKDAVLLTDTRDIYENNANNGARRVREAIFAVLPPWLVEEAKAICMSTIENGGGKPLAQRVADATKWFEAKGVRVSQLEEKVGAKVADWSGVEIAQLEVISRSLSQGETTVADEFPKEKPTAETFMRKAAPQPEPEQPSGQVTTPGPDEPILQQETDEPITDAQSKALHASLRDAGVTGREQGLAYCGNVIGRAVESTKDLTKAEASAIIDALKLDVVEDESGEGSWPVTGGE